MCRESQLLLSSYCFRIVFRLLIATQQQQQHLQAETELCSLVVVVVVAAASSSLLALTHRHTVTLTLTHANLRFAWLWPLARETQKKRENMQFCNNNNNSLLSTYFHCIYNPVFALHFGCASDSATVAAGAAALRPLHFERTRDERIKLWLPVTFHR